MTEKITRPKHKQFSSAELASLPENHQPPQRLVDLLLIYASTIQNENIDGVECRISLN